MLQLITDTLSNGMAMLWIVLGSVCHAYSYTAFYKSFGLIGVTRGEAIGNLHAAFAVLFVVVFALDLPAWYFFVGLFLATAGSLVMFTEPAESVAQLREQETSI
ncbi:Trimethylamine Permease [gamma proteobacterium IMCC2047]|nr:Trimethylamine Permease [gamma proteobacterium IMCC2047]